MIESRFHLERVPKKVHFRILIALILFLGTWANGACLLQFPAWNHDDAQALKAGSPVIVAAGQPSPNEGLNKAANWTKCGRAAWQLGDVATAEECYQNALTVLEALAPNSLALAEDLNGLGSVHESRGELAAAESYFRRSFSIATKIGAPSLELAASLNGLGKVAEQRGNLAVAERFHHRAFLIQRRLDPDGLALASGLMCLGRIAYLRTQYVSAEKYYGRSLSIRERIAPGSLDVVWSLLGVGSVAYDRGDLAQAEEIYNRALAIGKKIAPNSRAVAVSLTDLYLVAFDRGELAKAEEYQRNALAIQQKLAPEGLDLALSLHRIGDVLEFRGDLDEAEQYYRRALEIRRKLAPDSPAFAASVTRLGVIAYERGDLIKAEAYYRESLTIRSKVAAGSLDVASSLNLLGNVAYEASDFAEAARYYHKALVIRERLTPGSLGVAENLTNLGLVANSLGEFERADLYLQRALSLKQRLVPNSLQLANSLNVLGEVLRKRGELSRAKHCQSEALAIQKKLNPGSPQVSWTLSHLGKVAIDAGSLVEAEEYLRQALAIQERYAAGAVDHADILVALATVQEHKGQLQQAAGLYQQAFTAFENRVVRTGGNPGFSAMYAQYSERYINLLMHMGRPDLAFGILERSRSRSLLEMLAKAGVDIYKDVDPLLVGRERSLQRELVSRTNLQIHLLSGGHAADQWATVQEEIDSLLTAYRYVEEQIREANPGYAALTQPPPLDISAVQQQLLDHDSVLLEYSLGERNSYLWVVSSDSFIAYPLPKRSEVELLARHVYALLTAPNRLDAGETAMQRRAQLGKISIEYDTAAAKLSWMLLGAAYPGLRGKRLLIVSDGALQYIPFAALPVPDIPNPSRTRSSSPLALQHEIVNLPSASVLAELRRRALKGRDAPKEIAILADPVFSKEDSRVAMTANAPNRKHSPIRSIDNGEEFSADSHTLMRSVADTGLRSRGGSYLPRLVFSRLEAKEILSVTPAEKRFVALDFQASRSLAKSPELERYRIIHFATHGLLDNVHPELSGLVFSLVDRRGQSQEGFLGLQEIYHLNLPVDLVVLSACETALGKEIRGEGIIGLTRGFMYAGAARVMASLWKVDDLATAELMARFYRGIEVERMPPATALRKAQISMLRQRQWNFPFYWAAFQVQGEWK
ncbi:MAG TPA: tetratricopeptide repeat protein [Candidatus Angelobacter sp.]